MVVSIKLKPHQGCRPHRGDTYVTSLVYWNRLNGKALFPKGYIHIKSLEPVNTNLFGERVFAAVIKLRILR